MNEGKDFVLGTVAFLRGWKQERTVPGQAGDCRLFLAVHDGGGEAATADVPFRVERR